MAQAGLKPKNLKSGVHWTRSGNGKRKRQTTQEIEEPIDPDIAYDSDGDGKADLAGWLIHAPVPKVPHYAGLIFWIVVLFIIWVKYG